MTRFDEIMNEGSAKQGQTELGKLKIILNENEHILNAIKAALTKHKIKQATVNSIQGTIKEAILERELNGSKKEQKILNQEAFHGKGSFKLQFEELWGNLEISVNIKNPIKGKLIKGIAGQGLEIIFNYSK